ncbi:MAG: hypothetical protein QG551_7 [Patescibacteria group bacterium]|jgi:hypothetical protein|nr:hypothetical protein [Patescibacteria group bacterium]
MPKAVHIFPFTTSPEVEITIPINAEILSVVMYGANPHIVALVNPDAKEEKRKFFIFYTKERMRTRRVLNYIGTYGHNHVFEVMS